MESGEAWISILKDTEVGGYDLLVFFVILIGIVLILAFIFRERIKDTFYRPIIDLQAGPFFLEAEQASVTDSKGENEVPAYFLHLPVINKGSKAVNIEGKIASVEEEKEGAFSEIEGLRKIYLNWNHEEYQLLSALNKKGARELILGCITDPKAKNKPEFEELYKSVGLADGAAPFLLEPTFTPNTRPVILKPGRYRINLKISGSNMKQSVTRTIELEFSGAWSDAPEKMAQISIV